MTESAPRNEELSPQTEQFLAEIKERLLAVEPGSPITDGNGRFNEDGREIADGFFEKLRSHTNGNYTEVLEVCREAEDFLAEDGSELSLQIVKSVRGKAVYHAHRESAEGVLHGRGYSNTESTVVEPPETSKVAKRAGRSLERRAATLRNENMRLVRQDIQQISQQDLAGDLENILGAIEEKLSEFLEEFMDPDVRKKIVAGAMSAMVSACILLGSISYWSYNNALNENASPRVENRQDGSIEPLDTSPSEKSGILRKISDFVEDNILDSLFNQDYLAGTDEVPNISVREVGVPASGAALDSQSKNSEKPRASKNEVTQEKQAPAYVAQKFDGQCGPASMAILLSTLGPEAFDMNAKMEEITDEFVQAGYIDREGSDDESTDAQIIKFFKSKGLEATSSYEFLAFDDIREYFDNPRSTPVIINVNSNYLNQEMDHWAVLLGVAEIDGRKYVRLMDPLRSEEGFGSDERLDVRMTGLGDGSFLFSANAWPGVTNGLGVYLEN